jgi:D-beta-D-heptose 7-phosphate kinase/D-beta-D-heptose 1-phosphate adenosyltransferase
MELELPPFGDSRVMVLGDVMLDRYWEGPAARISPEAPVPVVNVENTREQPGGAGNVALNIAALGAGVALGAFTGEDEAADALASLLEGAGVDCDLRRVPGYATTTKLRVLSRHQQLLRLDFEQASVPAGAPSLEQGLAARLAGCGALVLSDYAKGALAQPAGIIARARELGVPVIVDPKGTDFARYRGATLLTPNLPELEAVAGPLDSESALEGAALALLADLQLEALLVTRGEHGMTLFRRGEEALHLPARGREVFDVTGAGDTVVGVLAASVAAGADLASATALANLAAGLVVGRLGTATVSAYELQASAGALSGAGRGVLGIAQLQAAVAASRALGEKLVFTNGCFDILHAGHVGYLQQARLEGDRLVVAVNSDASVRRLKGEGRPVNPLERRMAVLAGLESVDWVVSFDDDTPLELLRALRPDVLVKGGDYRRREDVVGWELVESWGGRVALMDETPGASTSALVDGLAATAGSEE